MTENITTPPAGAIKAQRVAKPIKDYWGLTAVIASFGILFGAILLGSLAVVVFGVASVIGSGNFDTSNATDITSDLLLNPWVIVASTLPMYIAWVSCAAWVSKYRSGVGARFKSTWAAFKDNFWLTTVKWYDFLIGLAVAVGFVLLQTLVMWLLPLINPDFDPSSTDNTQVFANLSGVAFFALGFGLVGFVGPIMEELFFRGLVLRGILNRFDKTNGLKLVANPAAAPSWFYKHRDLIAVLITSVIFGAFHFQSFELGGIIIMLITGSLGFGLGMMTLKLKRSAPAMFAHAFHNTIAVIALAAEKYFTAN